MNRFKLMAFYVSMCGKPSNSPPHTNIHLKIYSTSSDMQYCNTQTKKDDFKTNNPPFKNQAREPTFRLLMLARDMSLYYYFLVNVDRLIMIYLSII